VSVGAVMESPLLIVTGLHSEARIAAGSGMTVICSSSDPAQLRCQLGTFAHASVRGIISFGIAGGLDPSLGAGDLVVADDVLGEGGRWPTAPALSERLLAGTSIGRRKIVGGTIVGVEEVVLDPRHKVTLHERTGATAVDMESHVAAAYAASVGLPFAAVRVINDPASRSLPSLALNALKPDGQVDPAKVLRGLLREPSSILLLMRCAHDFNRATKTLRRCRSLLLGGDSSLVTADL
jgi:adenosylhomocysteine nucleosidase